MHIIQKQYTYSFPMIPLLSQSAEALQICDQKSYHICLPWRSNSGTLRPLGTTERTSSAAVCVTDSVCHTPLIINTCRACLGFLQFSRFPSIMAYFVCLICLSHSSSNDSSKSFNVVEQTIITLKTGSKSRELFSVKTYGVLHTHCSHTQMPTSSVTSSAWPAGECSVWPQRGAIKMRLLSTIFHSFLTAGKE